MGLTQITTGGVDDNINIDSNTLKVDGTNNRVGIGTAAPTALLHVAANDPAIYIQDANSTGNGINSTIQYRDSSDTQVAYFGYASGSDSHFSLFNKLSGGGLIFGTNSSERMRIGDDGKVYFGNFTSVGATAYIDKATSGSFELDIVASRSTSTNRDIRFFSRSNQESMRIDTSGRLGIGTTSPTQKLQVTSGNIFLDGTDQFIYLSSDADQWLSANSASNYIRFGAANQERMRIDSSGRLLVNNTSATQNHPLQVKSSASTAEAILIIARASDNIGELSFFGSDNSTRQGEIQYRADHANIRHRSGDLRFATGGTTERMRIDSSGRVLIGATSSEAFNGIPSALQIEGTSNATTRMSLFRTQNDASASVLVFAKARNTSHALLNNNDEIGKIEFYGADGNDTNQRAGMILCAVDGTPGGNDMPGRLVFFTTADGGTTPTERMRIDSSGQLIIGATSSNHKLRVAGTGTVSSIIGSTNAGGAQLVIDGDADGDGSGGDYASLFHSTSGNFEINNRKNASILFKTGSSENERMRIDSSGDVGINEASPSATLDVNNANRSHTGFELTSAHSTAIGIFQIHTNTSYSGDGFKFHHSRAGTNAMNFMAFDSGHAGTSDRQFTLRGDGNAYADGTWNANGADYAEFFESSTGAAIPVGTTVVLDNNKVRAATADDSASSIMGVVRPKEPSQASMTIGNGAWNKWQGKYLTDDFDRFILDEHLVYEWTEEIEDGDDINHSYESHQIPDGITVPDDVVGQTHDAKGNRFVHYRLNPDYDPDMTYVPREERDEWVIVGLIGQVKILDGQPMNDRWIKMRDVSDTVEEWFIR